MMFDRLLGSDLDVCPANMALELTAQGPLSIHLGLVNRRSGLVCLCAATQLIVSRTSRPHGIASPSSDCELHVVVGIEIKIDSEAIARLSLLCSAIELSCPKDA